MIGPSKTRARIELAQPSPEHVLDRIPTQPDEIVWVLDEAGVTLAVDDRVHDLYGYWPDEILAAGDALWWRRVHADDRERVEASFRTLFESGRPFDVEYRLQRRDGMWIWVRARASALTRLAARDGGACAHVVLSDASERRQTERRYVRAQQRAKTLFATAPFVTCWRRASGDFAPIFISENVTALFGYSPAQFVRSSTFYARHVHPDDRARVQGTMLLAVAKGRASCEYRMQHTRGEYRWIRDDITATYTREGGPLELVSYWTELTERKQWEDACRSMEANLHVLLARSPDPVAVCQKGALVEANTPMAEVCGYERSESLRGVDVGSLIDPRDRRAFVALLAQAETAVVQPPPLEVHWLSRKGTSTPLRCCGLPSFHLGEPALLLFCARG